MMIPIVALSLAQAITPATAAPAPESAIVTTRSGLRFQVLEAGSGRRPTRADAVELRYEVRLADGTLVEAPAEPVGMTVAGTVPGFTEALLLMNRGGRYRFWVPALLGYGERGSSSVPPNAELVFTVTLLRVGRPAPARPR